MRERSVYSRVVGGANDAARVFKPVVPGGEAHEGLGQKCVMNIPCPLFLGRFANAYFKRQERVVCEIVTKQRHHGKHRLPPRQDLGSPGPAIAARGVRCVPPSSCSGRTYCTRTFGVTRSAIHLRRVGTLKWL